MNVRSKFSNLRTQLVFRLWFHDYGKEVARFGLNTAFFARQVKEKLGPRRKKGTSGVSFSDPALANFNRFKNEFAGMDGWFSDRSQALWDSLLQFQQTKHVAGNLLEIGTWKGKSAACFSLYAEPAEHCVFVDRVILAELKHTIDRIRSTNNVFIECDSRDLATNPQFTDLNGSCRWIHIDGEHSGGAVVRDLESASSLLGPCGIICVDDFPNVRYPQITFGVSEFLAARDDLMMFLCGFNKGYICRVHDAKSYLEFIKTSLYQAMAARDNGDVTIWKTSTSEDFNCFGITTRIGEFDYRGPDGRPHHIQI